MSSPSRGQPPERTAPAAPVDNGLAEVLDEHAELGEILGQVEGAEAPPVLEGLLQRLRGFCERHFAREEQEGFLAPGAHRDPGPAVHEVLVAEHRELLARVRSLARRAAKPGTPFAEARREAGAIVRRLREHDAKEAALLRERAGVEAASADGARATSGALRVNLRRTAVGVSIPPEHRVLLECTAHLRGVHEGARALLREIHHPYVGWSETLQDLHRRAMSDLSHYLEHPRGPEAVEVFFQLYEKAIREGSSEALRETALRRYLQYLLAVQGVREHAPALHDGLVRAMHRLRALLAGEPGLALEASPGLRRLAKALCETEGTAAEVARAGLALLACGLDAVYARWLAEADPAAWWQELAGAPPGAPVPEAVARVSHARIAAHRARLDAAPDAPPDRGILELPDHAQLARACVEAAASVEEGPGVGDEAWRARLARIRWLLDVLAATHLRVVQDEALSEIRHASARVLRESPAARAAPVVRELFATLRERGLSSASPTRSLLVGLGKEALGARDPAWSECFVAEMVGWDFAHPEFAGFGEDWEIRTHPDHVGAIRTLLALVETRPEAAVPLVAALVVHLEIGGVAIADTDLFQRDVSRLLASGVAPILHPLKHLLRLLPVYFEEVGAEGELREVSTRIDEVGGRGDRLCHFLRKQIHVESNPALVDLIEAIGRFWATGDRDVLRRFLPPSLAEGLDAGDPQTAAMRALFAELAGEVPPEALFALEEDELEERLARAGAATGREREKARLLFRLRRLVGRKYELRGDDVLERLEARNLLDPARLAALRAALEAGDDEAAVDELLQALGVLQGIALRPGPVDAQEQIYRKRHVAVGIPSLYGSYREERFDAMGLALRVEALANGRLDRMLSRDPLVWTTREALERVLRWLRLLHRALRLDGCRARGVGTGIALLEQAIAERHFDVHRWRDVFQVIARSVEQIVRIRYREVYEPVLDRILPRLLERGVLRAGPGGDPRAFALERSEALLRDLLGRSLGLTQLDLLVGRVLRALEHAEEVLGPELAGLLVEHDPARTCVDLDGEPGPLDGAVHLGNKGYQLERLIGRGLPVPPGFVLTTEVFRSQRLLAACPELDDALARDLRRRVRRLERLTGRRFGDPVSPLLLSVRSTSTLSMPGVLDSFLNVGINEEIARAFGARVGSPWAAWDSWRRFLQLRGMAAGLDRDGFDAIMRDAKRRFGVEKKADLPAEAMHATALRYRERVVDHGTALEEEPGAQLRACIAAVLRSWDSEPARLYRRELQIADGWGTAVVVQSMVYGNLHARSGTGVLRTHTPRGRPGEVGLAGDFVVQGQGDDVVSGLVETLPIAAAERSGRPSLEADFPEIHAALQRHARVLVADMGLFHQEVEFTFESDRAEDLYLLQTRDSVTETPAWVRAFVPTEALDRAKVAAGIGAGGEALSGRVAHRAEDVERLRTRFGDDPILLLRPDTVPDDLLLVLRCDGMLTARGGATSHAALVAQRLGRTCVVGCRQLDVCEEEGRSEIGGHLVRTGDWLSISGVDGSVYLGRHDTTTVQREVSR